MSKMRWSFFNLWNESLNVGRKEKPCVARDRIWASELGGAMVDRYLKMTGVPPTNPPNQRSLRKFEAGNIWEWIVGMVLKRAGIFLESQGWVEFAYPGLLKTTGKIDFLAGGNPDWEKATTQIREQGLPDFIERATENIVSHFKEEYPGGMEKIVLEIKSVSSFMFEKYIKTGLSNPNHRLQAFHYLKATGIPEAHIVYVCKDDARMLEVGVFNPSPVEDEYKADISEITKYINAKTQPELEKMVIFDEEWGQFTTNWKVMYSNYLTALYGFPDQMAYEDMFKKKVAQWNRVVRRVKEGLKMTKQNKEIVEEIKKDFPNFDEIVKKVSIKEGKEELKKCQL